MSLCPMSWKNVKKLSRRCGKTFVHASAHHNHAKVAVDLDGNTWWVDPDGTMALNNQFPTTTAGYVKSGEILGPRTEHYDEIDRRLAELCRGGDPPTDAG